MTEDLAYDLRQKYAEIVGVHLEAVSNARIRKDYPSYFNALEDLFTIVKHKFKKKKSPDDDEIYDETFNKDKENKKTDLARYYNLRQNAITIANEYQTTFLGRTTKPEEVSKVENSLREIEMFLFYVMDKSKMFGSKWEEDGL